MKILKVVHNTKGTNGLRRNKKKEKNKETKLKTNQGDIEGEGGNLP